MMKSKPRFGRRVRPALTKPKIQAVNIHKWSNKIMYAHYILIGRCIPFWANIKRYQTKTVPRTWFHYNVAGANDDGF
jgi:hypothetical protein